MPRTTDKDGTPVPQRLLAAATRLFAEQGYDVIGIENGDEVTLTVSGDDAETTADSLVEFLKTDHDAA